MPNRAISSLFSKEGRIVAFLFLICVTSSLRSPLNGANDPPPSKQPDHEVSDGLFLTVNNPITTNVVNRVKDATRRFLDRPDHRGLKIVYDFNPEGFVSGTEDYGPCRDLAKFLLKIRDVTTVAFVHAEVHRHTLLPVFACKEIVMSHEGKFAFFHQGQNDPPEGDEIQFYKEVARGQGRIPAVVLRLVDKDMEVIEGIRRGTGGVWYIDKRTEADEKKEGFVSSKLPPVIPAGAKVVYDVAVAQKFSLCNLVKETRQEVAEAYQLPASSLREDPLQGRTPIAWRIVVTGPINGALQENLSLRIRRAIARRANFIILQLECGGGETQVASDLANFFQTLKDDEGKEPVMTVAWVTEKARDTATILAFGCTEIVMEKKAHLGDFERIIQQRPAYQKVIRESLEELALRQGYSPLLARGMVEPDLVLHRVRSTRGRFQERRLMEEKELEQDKKGEKMWLDEGLIKPGGPLGTHLKLSADLARELGVARHVVEGPSTQALPQIQALYGLDKVQDASPFWLDEVGSFFRHPLVSFILVMMGIAGLILELKIPGVAFPGILAAICFVLYFWSHSQLNGQMIMLAVLLFLLGLVLIALEIFVIPGFGVTGISGLILLLISLALATVVKMPQTTQEWLDFGATISTMGVSLGVAMALAFTVAMYLPHIPYANRLVLIPPTDKDEWGEGEEMRETGFASLLGAMGVAATPLRPAGKAQIGDDFVDVVAEGKYVKPGSRVQVIEIEGNRIVVKEI